MDKNGTYYQGSLNYSFFQEGSNTNCKCMAIFEGFYSACCSAFLRVWMRLECEEIHGNSL